MKKNTLLKKIEDVSYYSTFEQLDGSHPWQQAAPQGFVPYKVRQVFGGKVTYFNFALAKEMGLIPKNHPNQMNSILEKKLLETFCIQIINEYDELSKRKINPATIKPNVYMATRYLQLQHSNKQGKTSGDGRGIWNGTFTAQGKMWDVSSRGTGVTCLAPGAVQANRPLKTGGEEFGYGCGLAEVDELYGSAILSELMHLQGFKTERALCIIDLGRGTGIGVRAAPNLLRPAHLFTFLKQDRHKELKAACDYLLERQKKNNEWQISNRSAKKYSELAKQVSQDFAEFAASLEVEYVFAWLDWDGDNVLANGGIIDYGSVRQFGLRHDQYRYDDVERWSTNLNEQKNKAKLLVQVFAQMCDYLETGFKKPLKAFENHESVKNFELSFNYYRNSRLLYKMGFDRHQRDLILKNHLKTFNEFYKVYSYFERAKISGKPEKVADGVNKPALFNMRKVLRELPKSLSENFHGTSLSPENFFDLIKSQLAKQKNIKLGEKHRQRINRFQKLYKELVMATCPGPRLQSHLTAIGSRAHQLNSEDRITGNALIQIVDELISQIKKGMSISEVQNLIDKIIAKYDGLPEYKGRTQYANVEPKVSPLLYSKILTLVEEYAEDI